MKITRDKVVQAMTYVDNTIRIGHMGYSYYRMAKNLYENKTTWTVSIDPVNEAEAFTNVLKWLSQFIKEGDRRPITLTSSRDPMSGTWTIGTMANPTKPIKAVIDGHRVVAVLGRRPTKIDDPWSSGTELLERMSADPEYSVLHLHTKSREARDAVVAFLAKMNTRTTKGQLFMRDKMYNGWNNRKLPVRALDTVILPAGVAEFLYDDLDKFRKSESEYMRLGQPWHRGYIFHGPPGTGKTSVVQALAYEFGMNVYYLSLSGGVKSSELENLLSRIDPGSILLIEDIDTLGMTNIRTGFSVGSEEQDISLSDLLNALDGIITPYGLVTMLTTNHLSRLDPALLRPGRADQIIEVGYLDTDQAVRIINTMCPDMNFTAPGEIRPEISGAQITSAIKDHMYDKDGADLARILGEFFTTAGKEIGGDVYL